MNLIKKIICHILMLAIVISEPFTFVMLFVSGQHRAFDAGGIVMAFIGTLLWLLIFVPFYIWGFWIEPRKEATLQGDGK
jgi:hypothetical protein